MSNNEQVVKYRDVDYLKRYASDYHRWRTVKEKNETYYVRPLGLVETAFDHDALINEGRADTSALLTLNVESMLSESELRCKIILAWACLRAHHGLLRAKAVTGHGFPGNLKLDQHERHFVVSQLESSTAAVEEASKHTVFVEDHYSSVDPDLFYRHVMNTSRTINPSICLSKLFVLPASPLLTTSRSMTICRNFLFVTAHEITDGLSIHAQLSHFIRLLNTPTSDLSHELARTLANPAHLPLSLPQAQESLYPALSTSPARQRWRWAISRILRHTRRPPPASFPNPLRRPEGLLKQATPMPKLFDKVLDYSRTPPLNSYTANVSLCPRTSERIVRLCREIGVSIGAGCFALVGMAMMEMHERADCQGCGAHTSDAPGQHLPFVSSFPINPRPFFANPDTVPTSSLMLSFSDGFALPFLSSRPSSTSYLPAPSRFRLLARQAHRHLSVYQKRPRTPAEWEAVGLWKGLGSRAPRELLTAGYLSMVERVEGMKAVERRSRQTVQGPYPVRMAKTGATCGVSSVGDRRRWFGSGSDGGKENDPAFKARFVDLRANVRVRDGEFLVGSSGDDNGLHLNVSYDGCAISEEKAREWERVLSGLFEGEEDNGARKAVRREKSRL